MVICIQNPGLPSPAPKVPAYHSDALLQDHRCGKTKRQQFFLTNVNQCHFPSFLHHLCPLLCLFSLNLPLSPHPFALTLPWHTCWVWILWVHTRSMNTNQSASVKFLNFPPISKSSHSPTAKATGLNLKDPSSELL